MSSIRELKMFWESFSKQRGSSSESGIKKLSLSKVGFGYGKRSEDSSLDSTEKKKQSQKDSKAKFSAKLSIPVSLTSPKNSGSKTTTTTTTTVATAAVTKNRAEQHQLELIQCAKDTRSEIVWILKSLSSENDQIELLPGYNVSI
eukprot:TRINITY_DN2685_c0_g1_i1.p1 TRINITY_DN2685_c0_g1~~TRINITY_DN2685_c0_g1_i1.p1  ORF type:complete len:145 (-),score=20.48 TRINITY_DN2685_c0_g1_i1:161-595(-)